MKSTADSQRSWVVAVACSLVFLLGTLPARFGSQLFIAVLEYYGASRKAASFPFSVAYLMRSLSGPFAGYVGETFGLTTVTLVGSVFCVIGMAGCFFAQDMIAIDVFLGVIYGIGYGLSTAVLPEIVNYHFDKYRGIANGFVSGIASFGTMVGPPLLDIVLSHFGLSGTFLIISAVLLNSVPAMILVSMLTPETENRNHPTKYKKNISPYESENTQKTCKLKLLPENLIYCTGIAKGHSTTAKSIAKLTPRFMTDVRISGNYEPNDFGFQGNDVDEIYRERVDQFKVAKESLPYQGISQNATPVLLSIQKLRDLNYETDTNEKTPQVLTTPINIQRIDDTNFVTDTNEKTSQENSHILTPQVNIQRIDDTNFVTDTYKKTSQENSHILTTPINIQRIDDTNFVTDTNEKTSQEDSHILTPQVYIQRMDDTNFVTDTYEKTSQGNSCLSDTDKKTSQQNSSASINILWNPIFLTLTFLNSCHGYVMYTFFTITIDLVRDKSGNSNSEVYSVMAQALFDMFGRFTLSCLIDFRLLTESNFAALCFVCMGLSCLLLTVASGTYLTLTFVCFLALACGGNTPGLMCVVTRFVRKEKRAMAMACRLILYAPMSFTMSPLIGYFREGHGSYDGLLYILTSVCALCSILLLFLPRFADYNKN